MGDVVHALPVASAIHAAWPQTRLTWICDERWAPLLQGNPAISKIHTFPRRDFRGVGGFLRARHWYRGLRGIGADTALDLQGLLRSGLMARSSGAERTFGLSDAREGAGFFHTDRIPVPKNEHAVLRYLRCLPAVGIPVPEKLEWPLPAHPLPENFPAGEPFLALHPTSRGAGKSLGAASLAAFAETFQKNCRAKSSRRRCPAPVFPPARCPPPVCPATPTAATASANSPLSRSTPRSPAHWPPDADLRSPAPAAPRAPTSGTR